MWSCVICWVGGLMFLVCWSSCNYMDAMILYGFLVWLYDIIIWVWWDMMGMGVHGMFMDQLPHSGFCATADGNSGQWSYDGAGVFFFFKNAHIDKSWFGWGCSWNSRTLPPLRREQDVEIRWHGIAYYNKWSTMFDGSKPGRSKGSQTAFLKMP